MGWKLVEVPENDGPDILTDGELIGMSIFLATEGDQPQEDWNVYWQAQNRPLENWNVYWRAWQKLQVHVKKALGN